MQTKTWIARERGERDCLHSPQVNMPSIINAPRRRSTLVLLHLLHNLSLHCCESWSHSQIWNLSSDNCVKWIRSSFDDHVLSTTNNNGIQHRRRKDRWAEKEGKSREKRGNEKRQRGEEEKNECQSSLTFRVLISWNCEQFAAFALLFVAVQHGWKGQVNSIINPRLKLIFYRNRANAYSAYRINSLPTIHLIICNLLSQSRSIVQLSRTRITST